MIPNHGGEEDSPSQETLLKVEAQRGWLFPQLFRGSCLPPLTQSQGVAASPDGEVGP